MKPRLHGRRSQISSHVYPSANSKTSRARRASSARPVRLVACLVSSTLSVFVRLMAFGMNAIVVYKWLLQSTSHHPPPLTARCAVKPGSASPPGRAAGGVLQHDAGSQQLIADTVGLGEIFRLTRRRTLCDQGLDLRIRKISRRRRVGPAASLQECGGLAIEQSKEPAERRQQTRILRRARAVYVARQIEQGRACFRGVEVVVHR